MDQIVVAISLEALKIAGSLVGLATGAFVVIDRFLRHRPIAYFRPPRDSSDEMGLVVYNAANEAIVIDAVECEPTTMAVSFRDDWRDILEPDAKGGIAIIGANSQKVFPCIPSIGWGEQKPEGKVRITVGWSFTSSRWLPLVPVVLNTTVARLDQIRGATPPTL